MKTSEWLLAGGAVVVVVLLIAALMTGAGGSAQGRRYGQELPAGQGAGTGQGAGAGTAPYAGTGDINPSLLPQADTTPLTGPEISWILFMREEEQLAYDSYMRWAAAYPVRVFSNIASSETTHIAEVQLLIDRYGLQDHRVGNASAGYTDPALQSLFTTLAAQGDASETAALEAGLAIEERDIADLDMALSNTTRADITQVYENLKRGSENHRSAFLRQLGR